ncbi:hypothetical protein Poli38472_010853 [Pythium oligandrum]|uniref:glutamate--tRNA ligase n=1 Tax=Pythium oligandrum TaxID=41045 RepID=A0A8K1CFD6_PYTOL|nr:hypothetical protein Poli38472_010853 [Pythium oligandrum]|eukprot:TMW61790.1 hypothetical protein Poli38472_010853 [Pythium oligandrum]
MATEAELTAQIAAKGEEIRVLKSAKDESKKEELQAAIAQLLALKTQFKEVTGKDYGPPPKQPKEKKKAADAAPEEPKDPNKKSKKELNKERKKAAKAAIKAGGDLEEEKKEEKAAAAPVVKKEGKAAKPAAAAPPVAAPVFTGAVGCVLPTPKADQDGAIVFSSQSSALPLASYVVAVLSQQTQGFQNHIDEKTIEPTLTFVNGDVISGDFAVARYLCRAKPSLGLFGIENNAVVVSQVDSWLDFALSRFSDAKSTNVAKGLALLDVVLKERTFLVAYALSLADIAVWSRLHALKLDVSSYANVSRWWKYLSSQSIFAGAEAALKALPAVKKPQQKPAADKKPVKGGDKPASQKGKNTGSCPPLQGAVDGQVVTRFPPEPSGYLHIGHLKACLLNDYYARHYNGKLILRFDDTNPSKEKDEFEQSIQGDLKRLNILPDMVTYTSDSFPKIIDFARQLIREGNGYMDNTAQEKMRDERMNGVDSVCRNQDPAVALELFEKMLKNDPEAAGYCLRGKIDMQAKNKTLRDPVFFRANATPHHRTGTKYCAYPTYDFACPIVDSLEGVTHALRTTEYNDRDEQYQWVIKALKLRPVRIHAFARMNFVHSVLSKRKLQWFVDNGHVEGWNDPRFPTIQGVLRRGVQQEALREFIVSQGASRRIVDMEWDKFWTMNKRIIDATAYRYFALNKNNAVPLELTNVSADVVGLPIARHPKDASMGNKIMRFSKNLLLERDDVNLFQVDEEVTLMRHGNIIVRKIHKDADGQITKVEAENHPEGDFKKTKLKITWLADVPDLVDCVLVEFDHLISKPKLEESDNFQDHLTPVTRAEMHAIGDHELRTAKKNDVVQLERRGFFRVDQPYISKEKPLVLFMVPDGKAKAMSTLSTNLAHR